jgi:hypothetical protein
MTPAEFPLDFDKFQELLYAAAKVSLRLMKSDPAGETLYSFALVTTGLFGYVFPNGNTEECVLQAARKYLDQTGDFDNNLDLALKYCRWEPTAYWRFFQAYHDPFKEVNSLIESVDIPYSLTQLSNHEFDYMAERLEQTLFNVLRSLETDGEFGAGSSREMFYVNISYQDQTYEDLHRCAEAVNPKPVSDRLWSDLCDVMRFWDELRAG